MSFEFWSLDIVSDFGFRASDLEPIISLGRAIKL